MTNDWQNVTQINCDADPAFTRKYFRNGIRYKTVGHISDNAFVCLQTSAQQALTGTINSSMQAVQAAQASLDDFDTLPPLGTDAVRLNLLFPDSKWIELSADMSAEQPIPDLCHQRIFFFCVQGIPSLAQKQDG